MLIRAVNVTKSYGTKTVLNSLSFAIHPGDKIGLVGPHGSGKTTLLRILVRELEPDDGELLFSGEPEIGYVRQDIPTAEDVTVRSALLGPVEELEEHLEEVRAEIAEDPEDDAAIAKLELLEEELANRFGTDYRQRVERILGQLGFSRDRLDIAVRRLSPGERARLELARVLVTRPDLLVLDEPTNFLDISQREWLETFVEEFPGAVLVVSNDRFFLNNTVTRILELRRGRVREYDDSYDDYEAARRAEQEKLARDHAEPKKSIHRSRTATAGRNKSNTGQANLGSQHADKPSIEKKPGSGPYEPKLPHKRALLVKGVTKSFGRRRVLDGIGFEMNTHERVALIGPAGSGKTVLLRTVVGELKPDKGETRIGSGLRIGYFPQDLGALDLNSTAVEEIRKSGCDEVTASTLLGTLLLNGELATKRLRQLSLAEQSKALLARILASDVDLLILDEPTNHLDIEALVALEQLLAEFPGAILFATHDRAMLDRLATRIVELKDGKLTDFRGRYDQYRTKPQAPTGTKASARDRI